MKDRYFITVTTIHGSKHYSIKQIIKYIIAGVVIFVLLLLSGGYLYINFLQQRIGVIDREKKLLFKQKEQLQQKLTALNIALLEKKESLEELSSRINDLETQLEITKDALFNPPKDIAKLSKEDIDLVLKYIPSGSPVKSKHYISAKFGWRVHPILKRKEFHPGLDLSAVGKIPIYATANGIVYEATRNRYGYGKIVKIAHLYGFSTVYAHLKKYIVKKGDFVKKGQIIGYMGSTGLSTGQHLHYEVRYNTQALNPYYFIKWKEKSFETIFKKERYVPWESLIKGVIEIPSQKRVPPLVKKQKS